MSAPESDSSHDPRGGEEKAEAVPLIAVGESQSAVFIEGFIVVYAKSALTPVLRLEIIHGPETSNTKCSLPENPIESLLVTENLRRTGVPTSVVVWPGLSQATL